MLKKILLTATICVGILCITSQVGYAQPPDPGGDPDETPIPFDGGLSLALAAGVGYGIKKVRDARKAKQESLEK